MLEKRLRVASGLVLAAFVALHLANHALGIVSIGAMDAVREPLSALWRSWPGTLALYGAFALHFTLALRSLHRRRTLRMPGWEAAQLLLGLAFVPLVAVHATSARGLESVLGLDVGYEYVLAAIWTGTRSPWQQTLLVVVAWLHLCVGLHFWLRLRPWYPRAAPWLLAAAVALPVLALAGFVAGGSRVLQRAAADANYLPALFAPFQATDPARRAVFAAGEPVVLASFAALLAAVLLARWLRHPFARRGRWRLRIGPRLEVTGTPGQTVLEALRAAQVPHASVCGGRARCTTCRVRVHGAGAGAGLEPPSEDEARALARVGAGEDVRLACQLRPRGDLEVRPLLAPDATAADARGSGGVAGREQVVTVLFIDLRGSTRLGETRLPYDVLFVLNRFFTEMTAALADTGGHYAQFNGDGLMALYGLDGRVREGARDALRGAARMCERLAALNAALADELPEPLRVGIGVHCGEAIVGSMGPPSSPIVSAIGDHVNVAARLEAHSKQLGCTLVVSEEVVQRAGMDTDGLPRHEAAVRGRDGSVCVYAVAEPGALAARLAAA